MTCVQRIMGVVSALVVGTALGWATAALPYRDDPIGQAMRTMTSPLLSTARQTIKIGAWSTSLATGGPDADMFMRAHVARTGLLALNRSETLYFSATSDDQGQPLHARCQYEVTGVAPTAKWWSLTVYASDHFLVSHPSNRYSISIKDAGAGDAFKVLLGSEAQPGLWLPTGTAGGFSLLLRLYNPSPETARDPGRERVPNIVRTGMCR